jgi:L-asparaginase II
LKCGAHTPIHEESAFNYVRTGVSTPFKENYYSNCSGKHAGFLALCKYLKVSTEDYLLPSHPVQQLVHAAACDVFGMDKNELIVGVDGCSAPTFALPVV